MISGGMRNDIVRPNDIARFVVASGDIEMSYNMRNISI